MEELLATLKNRSNQSWLIGYNSEDFCQLTQDFISQFSQAKIQINNPKIILAEADPYQFLAAFLAGVITESSIFLGNHQWGKQEWQEVLNLVKPDLIIGLDHLKINFFNSSNNLIKTKELNQENNLAINLKHKIMIPTGGSSGKIRFAIHTWETLANSVQGFLDYFQINQVNSFCCLPVYHVSGLMQFMRSFLTQGKLAIVPYHKLKKETNLPKNVESFFISLVPTQLQVLLELYPHWLAEFKTVLLGGAPPWLSLLELARNHKINLALTYGMTETASQIVTLKPQDFLKGNNSTGQILPHAQVKIVDPLNNLLDCYQTGIIIIESNSSFLGYYPQINPTKILKTDDLGYFDSQDYLHIVGRNSQKIITGGENVYPTEVETAILATGLVQDVAVIGTPDNHWGQAVTAIYIPKDDTIFRETIQTAIQDKLSRFKQPKYWICVNRLPRNQQGKINLQKLDEIVIVHRERNSENIDNTASFR
ncbi:AMP-dependent synthetase and ligase [Rippkaea orientalis PCC 8801]|uniref:AMP-dependent synthetase and ligase n=1 Tax=Rippkaea orientalis (strain PCC 8801 / RF-1) TaxID=41431 RepID=B7K2D7_RIPO1|nr:2-succinylbenzoate--CoA ligase [Rippkaea orientalis]ACK65273.1 AMP-dependent synthetase and ligase [Rippkaea orientalis PCC 8801]